MDAALQLGDGRGDRRCVPNTVLLWLHNNLEIVDSSHLYALPNYGHESEVLYSSSPSTSSGRCACANAPQKLALAGSLYLTVMLTVVIVLRAAGIPHQPRSGYYMLDYVWSYFWQPIVSAVALMLPTKTPLRVLFVAASRSSGSGHGSRNRAAPRAIASCLSSGALINQPPAAVRTTIPLTRSKL